MQSDEDGDSSQRRLGLQWGDLLLELLLAQAPRLGGLISFRDVALHFDGGGVVLLAEDYKGEACFDTWAEVGVGGRRAAAISSWKSRRACETEVEGAEAGPQQQTEASTSGLSCFPRNGATER